jgi:hypothetical protein
MSSLSWAIMLARMTASRSVPSGVAADDEPLALGDPRFLDPEVGRRDFLVAALP